jgi:hypothetical protein
MQGLRAKQSCALELGRTWQQREAKIVGPAETRRNALSTSQARIC